MDSHKHNDKINTPNCWHSNAQNTRTSRTNHSTPHSRDVFPTAYHETAIKYMIINDFAGSACSHIEACAHVNESINAFM